MKKFTLALVMILAGICAEAQNANALPNNTDKKNTEVKFPSEAKGRSFVPITGLAKGQSLVPMIGLGNGESFAPVTIPTNGNATTPLQPAKGMRLVPISNGKKEKPKV